ncbi:MAG: hypothetical protein HQM09_03840 [Candidatus Riflebacteria bacterium]|nr:hypothetical protein [Candidatus Riflebacteria bacterium]
MPTIAYLLLLMFLSIGGAEMAIGIQKKNGKALLNGYDYFGIVFGIGGTLHALILIILHWIP